MDVKEYELKLDKIELLTDLANAEDDIKNKRVFSHEKIKSMYLKK
jgi:hypothetical protein